MTDSFFSHSATLEHDLGSMSICQSHSGNAS